MLAEQPETVQEGKQPSTLGQGSSFRAWGEISSNNSLGLAVAKLVALWEEQSGLGRRLVTQFVALCLGSGFATTSKCTMGIACMAAQ